MTLDVALQQAIAHHHAGRLQEAEQFYRAILQAQPNHPDANHNLGVLAVQVKQPAAALPHLKAALELNPNQGQYWLSYIDALIQTGQTDSATQMLSQSRQRGLNGVAFEALAARLSFKGQTQSAAVHQLASNNAQLVSSAIQKSGKNKSKTPKNASCAKKNPDPQEVTSLLALLNSGRYMETVNLARTMTEHFPQYGTGWMVLGAAFMHIGRSADALTSMQIAATLSPRDASVHCNLGAILKKLGKPDEAVNSFRQALRIKPDYAEAHFNLGVTFKELHQPDNAEASYRRALQIKPDYADALNNLGLILKDSGRLDEACACYQRVLQIKPDSAETHNNLGNIHKDFGRLNEAEACYKRALQINPDSAEAHNNLGLTLNNLGKLDEANISFQQALLIKPEYAEAHNNLGINLYDLGRLDEAENSFQRAIQINPRYAEAHNNLGSIRKDLGRLIEAEASFRRALEIKPDYSDAYSSLLFSLNYVSGHTPSYCLAEARQYGLMASRKATSQFSDWPCLKQDKRLRIGFVSGDFRNHPAGYFLESLLGQIDQTAVELIAYPTDHKTDELTARVKPYFAAWKPLLGKEDEAAARLIRADGVHILLDLSGHTQYNRLPMFAWKPAPVQVSWLGYFATTGVAAIDYLLADPWALPETEEAYFTEKIWRLPETRLCFTPPNIDVKVSPLPAISNGYITFGCFNNLAKLNDDVVALWARVLSSVTGSRLFLKAKQLNEASVQHNIFDRFAAHGIGADRLILEGPESRDKYFEAYHRVDIALDPFPYPGGTTSVEGLWMGVPVLTLTGERFLSRQGVGILMNAGLSEWVATDHDDYVARAVSHATDLQRLSDLRGRLRQQVLTSPIFDAPRFAKHFEAALRGMWQKWCDGQTRI
ncbi:MAG: tetratricopeptide repeat protein [Gallionella sp.]|nr:tetratricopeptide repeat protein [Gallionella sp.]